MKKLLILFIVLLISTKGYSQPCFPYGKTFSTQTEIDNFHATYPDCTEIMGGLYVIGDDITNLNGLNVITSVTGIIYISGNPGLLNLKGLGNIPRADGLIISKNAALNSLTGIDSLTYISSTLYIGENPSLTTLSGLESVTHIGGCIQIFDNPSLIDLAGLNNLVVCGGAEINNNDVLTSLTGLEFLSDISEYLRIENNNSLTSLSGLENLTSIGEWMDIVNNPLLTDLSGLDNIESIGYLQYGHVWIKSNSSLINLNGLENLTIIGGELNISGNTNLTSLSGLTGLTTLQSGLIISDNNKLINLTGLENLSTLDVYSAGDLKIYSNDSLISLSGLDNINAGSIKNVFIYDNNVLSNCAIRSICAYLSNPHDTVIFNNNDIGCKDQLEVNAVCDKISVEEFSFESLFSIFPNPSDNKIIIETDFNGDLSILNLTGEELRKLPITKFSTQIDISGLPMGGYFVKITGGKKVLIGKFVKQ